jgi:MFS family permease
MSISRAIELFTLPISLIQRALKALVILTPAFIGKFAPVCRISRIGRRGSERRNIRRLSLWPDIELRVIILGQLGLLRQRWIYPRKSSQPTALVLAQVLSGVTGAVIGVLTVIVVADLTAGTGRFNLAIGVFGALSGIAASISTTVTGYLFQSLGPHLGYAPLAAVAALGTAVMWTFLTETKPGKYED